MGYRNLKMGYTDDILSSRAIIEKNSFALIPEHGLVKNNIPGFENCEASILGSPKLGASFVDYIITFLAGGKNKKGFGGEGVETFAFVIDGSMKCSDGENEYLLEKNGYIYVPPHKKMFLENASETNSNLFLYKRRYKSLSGKETYTVVGNTDSLSDCAYEGMENVKLKDLLPTDDIAFDMNFHILTFDLGASHGYIETHVQEHGALVLTGQGMYNLANNWIPVKKGDYLFMAAYTLQAGYATGKTEKFSYIYSKDCNRDEEV